MTSDDLWRRPIAPMLARPEASIPAGMAYEPKWDGWRCILVRDGTEVRLWSRHGTDLTAYFPELVRAATVLPERCILDGEVVIIEDGKLQYTRLASRHSTAIRADRLAQLHPAHFIAFDVLGFDQTVLLDQPFEVRRQLLEALWAGAGDGEASDWPKELLLSPVTRDRSVAEQWFTELEAAGLDGVMAKPLQGSYQEGQRALVKVKHRRTADVVAAGFRTDRNHSETHPSLGSVLLGLFDDAGVLHLVGVCAGFPDAARADLARMFAELEVPRGSEAHDEHPWGPAAAARSGARVPDGIMRWREPRDEVHLTSPLLVLEVEYDYLHDGYRFRSNTNFVRWRSDRTPQSCRFDQLEPPEGFSLTDVLGAEPGSGGPRLS